MIIDRGSIFLKSYWSFGIRNFWYSVIKFKIVKVLYLIIKLTYVVILDSVLLLKHII